MRKYKVLTEDWIRMEHFVIAMNGFSANEDFNLALTGFDWTKVSIVVNAEGAHGPASIELASTFSNLRRVAHNLEEVVAEGRSNLSGEVEDRIVFEKHNIIETQRTIGTDVYLVRAIFHN
jgi:6-hydroxytryprostatin B O-methyltransferase